MNYHSLKNTKSKIHLQKQLSIILTLNNMFHKQTKILLSIWTLLSGINLFAQDIDLRTFNYARADSIALHFPKGKYKTYAEIVEPLTANLETDQEKFRVIFRWIADNVSYSFSNKSDDPDKTLVKRKAVCAGYSSLLKQMCNQAGLECNIIDGWAKNEPGNIGTMTKETAHAWNEVKLNGKWYLTDITWASGTYDFKKKKFHKNFDSAYFLPTPDFFIKQHFPIDKKMQMLDTIVKRSVFMKSCVWYEGADKYGFIVSSPKKGRINQNVKKDFTLAIKLEKPFTATDTIQNFEFVIKGDKADEIVLCKKTVNYCKATNQCTITLTCRFPQEIRGEQDVNLYYGFEAISGFRINFH